jgi:hypothetical protein
MPGGGCWCSGMELSAELFSQIVASVGADPSKRLKHEKRRADRLALRLDVRITPSVDPLSIEAASPRSVLGTIRDLSSRGVSLEHRTPMAYGAQFLLHLLSNKGQPAVHLLCSVVHCRESQQDNCYIIGAEFTCVQDSPVDAGSLADGNQVDRIRHSILD